LTFSKIRFSKLKRYHFVDINDIDIGSLEDLVLDVDTLVPTYLLLGAGFFEELMEELGEKADVDELAPIDSVSEKAQETMLVNLPFDDLQTTSNKGALPFAGIKYSDLLKLPIIDSSQQFEGSLIDMEIHGNKSRFIFRSPLITENLQNQGYYQSFEISFLTSQITLEDNQILLPCAFEDILQKVREIVEPQMKGITHIEY
jgi:sporulation protein YlmC with PRC-barrel domain